jgi:hypothetical protein
LWFHSLPRSKYQTGENRNVQIIQMEKSILNSELKLHKWIDWSPDWVASKLVQSGKKMKAIIIKLEDLSNWECMVSCISQIKIEEVMLVVFKDAYNFNFNHKLMLKRSQNLSGLLVSRMKNYFLISLCSILENL